MLKQIKSFFNETGIIYIRNDIARYRVSKLKDIIKIIIPHFNNFPLITQKQSDYILFKEIVKLMNKGNHLNKNLLIELINLRASMNRGLSAKLSTCFSNIKNSERPKVSLPKNIDYN